jgi:hypothetical protein
MLSAILTAALVLAASPAAAAEADEAYIDAIERTTAMVWDPVALDLANRYGLDVVNVTWEDTGRSAGSSIGPNISDMTIQVPYTDPESGEELIALMPVIRYPNFSDLTGDVDPDLIGLLVGNEKGDELRRITLTELLADPGAYLSDPGSWEGGPESLLADRDTHVLVSAQAAFLPIPSGGEATFNPVLFNYQSYEGDPAVLTILATREGTSITIIDNTRDAFPVGWTWGQRLFFNADGERAPLTGRRLSDVAEEGSRGGTIDEGPSAGERSGVDMVLVIQVPLRQKNPWYGLPMAAEDVEYAAESTPTRGGDVERAVIGHGEIEGPFTEIGGLDIERDEDYPIRVTVQFYKATSDGIVTEADLAGIAESIEQVYEDADYVGSLVVDPDPDRVTNHDGPEIDWDTWWQAFADHLEERFGGDVIARLWELLGPIRAR